MASFLENALARKSAFKATSVKVNGVKFKLDGHVKAASAEGIAELAAPQSDIKLTFPKVVTPEGFEYIPTDIVEDGKEIGEMLGVAPRVKVSKAANAPK